MTERKSPGASWESWVEQKIRAGMEDGAFENLPGKGKPIPGLTEAHDDDWWIVEANIVLAVHHRGGEPLDSSAVRAIALHEIGHLLGLDHTTDTANIMTPKVRVKELSDADRATARLLYKLPPGKVK